MDFLNEEKEKKNGENILLQKGTNDSSHAQGNTVQITHRCL